MVPLREVTQLPRAEEVEGQYYYWDRGTKYSAIKLSSKETFIAKKDVLYAIENY